MTEIKNPYENQEENDFASLLEQSLSAHDNFRAGDKVTGTIVGISKDSIFVDISGKSEATIPAEEFRDRNGALSVKTGEKLTAYVVASGAAGIELTSCIGRGTVNQAILSIAKDEDIPVEGLVSAKINGGFTVMIDGVRAFCPVSQIDRKYSNNDADYLNKRFMFAVTELKSRDCIVSRRTLLEREAHVAEETLKGKLSVGDVVKGKITRTAEFGVFVDFGGIEGLVPRSELARSRSVTTDQFTAGQDVSVKILAMDWESKKFSLSIKETEKDPWTAPAVSEGTEYNGTVTNIIKGGAFVEILPGLEGFIPLSKMSYTKRVMKAEDVVSKGDEVKVKLISLDLKERRMTLELMTGEVDPWSAGASPVSEDIIEAKVESVKSSGVVLRLPNGMEGFLPRREIICDRNADLDRMFKAGDTIKVVTKELKKDERRIILSQKEIESREERESMKQYMKRESEDSTESSLGSQFGGMFADLKKKLGE